MIAKDGGPAFPLPAPLSATGMTMRDYFAAAALISGRARETAPEWELREMFGSRVGVRREEIIAAEAYQIADAMLRERAK